MKINIDYRLIKNKILNTTTYSIAVVLFIIMELLVINNPMKLESQNSKESVKIVEEKDLKSIIKLLEDRDIVLISAQKNQEEYLFKVSVEGSKEEVLKKLKEVENFYIYDYEAIIADHCINGILTLKYNNRGVFEGK